MPQLQSYWQAARDVLPFRKDDGEQFDNLAFIQMDPADMATEWTEKFDLVTVFDACHDQTRPDLVRD